LYCNDNTLFLSEVTSHGIRHNRLLRQSPALDVLYCAVLGRGTRRVRWKEYILCVFSFYSNDKFG